MDDIDEYDNYYICSLLNDLVDISKGDGDYYSFEFCENNKYSQCFETYDECLNYIPFNCLLIKNDFSSKYFYDVMIRENEGIPVTMSFIVDSNYGEITGDTPATIIFTAYTDQSYISSDVFNEYKEIKDKYQAYDNGIIEYYIFKDKKKKTFKNIFAIGYYNKYYEYAVFEKDNITYILSTLYLN